METTIPGVEERLQNRYHKLVREHTGQAHATAAGPRHLLGAASTKAATMAAWRFYRNPRVTPTKLARPLLDAARQAVARHCDHFALVIHDWSKLDYRHHTDKSDRIILDNPEELGYDLLTALLVSDRDGSPLAPLRLRLQAAAGAHSSHTDAVQAPDSRLDELLPVMAFVGVQRLPKRVVHLIDREADSVFHYRQWDAADHLFVVRADDDRYVRYEGVEQRLPQVVEALRQTGAFRSQGTVTYKGQPAHQLVAEAAVVLERPAHLHRVVGGRKRRYQVRGRPLPVRLVVSELRDDMGQVLARWLLLTNVPAEVSAATIALWYYWRWQVESYFKLLKSAGQHVEQWQQETAAALLRRLLVASMACVLVWRLARSTAPEANEARAVLMRLSGRQVEWGKKFTEEALLAGLWVLLAIVDTLERYTPAHLRRLANFIMLDSG